MTAPNRRVNPPASRQRTLARLCEGVIACRVAYDDVKDEIEERAFDECRRRGCDRPAALLADVARMFEQLENKNEENLRDLADVCTLIGELLQSGDRFHDSIAWLQKAVVVDDRFADPFHSLAQSYVKVGDIDKAIHCLEQEIRLAPGSYFAYLDLARLYERAGRPADMAGCLQRLLERDGRNVQALHLLIKHYQSTDAGLDVSFLRKRLTGAQGNLNRAEMLLWVFHMGEERRLAETLPVLLAKQSDASPDPVMALLTAHVLGRLGRVDEQAEALRSFARDARGDERVMRRGFEEFAGVFGAQRTAELESDLARQPGRGNLPDARGLTTASSDAQFL